MKQATRIIDSSSHDLLMSRIQCMRDNIEAVQESIDNVTELHSNCCGAGDCGIHAETGEAWFNSGSFNLKTTPYSDLYEDHILPSGTLPFNKITPNVSGDPYEGLISNELMEFMNA